MADLASLTSLYAQPPSPVAAPTNGFNSLTPGGVVGLAQGINDIQGRQGLAAAYRNNVGPDGTINVPGLIRDSATSGQYAGEGVHQAIGNARAAVEYGAAKLGQLNGAFSSLTGIERPTAKDVYDLSSRMAVSGVPATDIKRYQDFILSGGSPEGIKRNAAVVGNQVLGQGAGELVPGGYDPTTKQPVLVPRGQVNTKGATGGVITQPMEGATAAVGESQKAFVEDQKRAAGTLANLRNLDIALPLVQKLNSKDFGPGSPTYANVRRSLITIGAIDPNKTNIPDREQVNKYLLKYATLAQNSGRSDQALGAALNSNPNIDLTQPSNLHLMKNQIGLDKMEAAIPSLFKLENPSTSDEATYNDYKSRYFNRIDRRVFSYDKLDPQERRDLITSLGGEKSAAYKKFERSYELAKAAGFLTSEKNK